MKIYLETLGCQMNRLDSELILSSLRSAGHEFVDEQKAADVVLYNTCSVRQHAEDKVYSRLGADGIRKKHHRPSLIVGVLGCMAQKEGRRLRRKYPQVDIVCGPGQIARLPDLVAEAAAGKGIVCLDPGRKSPRDRQADEALDELDLSRSPGQTPHPTQAFVRIARGCNNFCAYCIVPYVRGPERSRKPRDIVREVTRLVEAGRTEITLLGQTVNRYRWQEGELSAGFADLLSMVSGIAGLRRLRFVTSHPNGFGTEVLQAMRDLPNVCRYLHVPAQSGSDAVLRRMNRGYSRSEYDDLVDRAREIMPDIVLAGDFIVGFPGETEQDHRASVELIQRSGYKNTFVFRYSPRPGTSAATYLADDIPPDVKKRRNRELLDVQQRAGLEHHRGYIGLRMEVLVTGPSTRVDKQARQATPERMQLAGRTRGDHIVVFDGPESWIGRYVDVSIEDANSLTLFGRA